MSQSTLVGAAAPDEPVQVRQGDVLLVPCPELPPSARVERNGGRIILAEGEVTGHAHAIAIATDSRADARTRVFNGSRYLEVDRPVTLRHEEHDPIRIVGGTYRIVLQREWTVEPGGSGFEPVRD